MIEGELLLSGVDWRTLNGVQFFSAAEAIVARILGGRDALERRIEEMLTEKAVKAKGRAKMQGKPVPTGPTKRLTLEAAKKMQVDAESYEMNRGA